MARSSEWRPRAIQMLRYPDQARYVAQPASELMTGYLLLQNNCTTLVETDKWNVFLPTSIPILLIVASVF